MRSLTFCQQQEVYALESGSLFQPCLLLKQRITNYRFGLQCASATWQIPGKATAQSGAMDGWGDSCMPPQFPFWKGASALKTYSLREGRGNGNDISLLFCPIALNLLLLKSC